MEEEGLTLQQSMGLLDEAKEKIDNLKGSTEKEAKWVERLKAKFESVVTKNPDIEVIRDVISSSHNGENLLKYCPLTSVDCERSFR